MMRLFDSDRCSIRKHVEPAPGVRHGAHAGSNARVRSAAAAAIVVCAAAAGCSDGGTGPDDAEPVDVAYALANVGGVWPDQTTFIQGLTGLPTTSIGIDDATEIASSGTMLTYGDAIYIYTFGAPARMTRYVFDDDGVPIPHSEMVTPGANTYSTVQFISPTLAYASVAGGLAKLVRFDPSDMRITGELELSSLARPDAANSMWFIGSHVRDGKLFLAVDYQQNSTAAFDSAFVAVIDLETEQLEKLISDPRTAMIFAAGPTVQSFAEDANGDIYVQARGNRDIGGSSPSGILRIRAGQTDFDPDYFFDLDDALGGPGYGITHFPDEGVTFTFRAEDPGDRWEFNGPNHRMYRIDLASRASLGPVDGVPLTNGSSTQIMRRFESGHVHFVVSSDDEDAVYTYDVASGDVDRAFTMTGGMCVGLERVGE